ncbi:nucleolar MIF4G domain-containing protein 1-like [Lytechinus variegatus]|uniref:nucleolar MIF4G domain-containing protein 1-like n=1 Tax=Lytechinus variegatus TaxID=7654 RepID=UPI001BB2AB41|nr:nucleolar MIF4G domain-containing protein 1-like [Lytechinus variegatus]
METRRSLAGSRQSADPLCLKMNFGKSQRGGSRRPMQQNLRRARKAMKKMVQIAEDESQDGNVLSDGRSFKKEKGQLSRKQRRKESRKMKKARKHAFLSGKDLSTVGEEKKKKSTNKPKSEKKSAPTQASKTAEKKAMREEKIKREKEEQRKRELLAANEDEEKNIRRLEKGLNFRKKRKTKEKITPTAFKDDGLDYLLDIVNPQILEAAMDEELMGFGKNADDSEAEGSGNDSLEEDSESLDSDGDLEDDTGEEELTVKERTAKRKSDDDQLESRKKSRLSDEEDGLVSDEGDSELEDNLAMITKASKTKNSLQHGKKGKVVNTGSKQRTDLKQRKTDFDSDSDDEDFDDDDDGEEDFDVSAEDEKKKTPKMDPYGNIIGQKPPEKSSTYIPPHKRAEMMGQSMDAEKKAKMDRLRKQLKGSINRLSESNIVSILNQIEELYLTNSRNDMNETLCALIQDACISSTITPDRLVMEHVLLISVLHSVIGSEVGAHVLQSVATRFDKTHCDDGNYGDSKEIDNIIMLFIHLYNFKVVHCVLIYDLIKKFSESFTERHIELLLQILKNAGATLRKDDPSSLKDIILLIQSKANQCPDEFKQQSRVKFMLETIGALRNNNLRRIPNYDPTNLDRLRKLHRSIIKDRGSSDSTLHISLADLIMADQRGRWWIVGSAWSGLGPRQEVSSQSSGQAEQMTGTNQEGSQKITELSRQQRMNTDIRRTIFSIIMTAEDYTDAFEKLVRLGQKGGRDREVVHVTLDCCQQERSYNPYYAYLSTKLCQFDRKFRMAFQFALWDKIRLLDELSPSASKNLALLLSHLMSSKALPLSVLKIVEFADMNKHTVRFLSSLLTDLLEKPDNVITAVFGGVAMVSKLRVLREGLGLFMHHFLLNTKRKTKGGQDGEVVERLKRRISVAESAMQGEEGPVKL